MAELPKDEPLVCSAFLVLSRRNIWIHVCHGTTPASFVIRELYIGQIRIVIGAMLYVFTNSTQEISTVYSELFSRPSH
jgi:hypothetical protein